MTTKAIYKEGLSAGYSEVKFMIREVDEFNDTTSTVKIYDKEDAKKLAAQLLEWANS
jgi:hypothetical protein